ncbi:MAG: hypothetical protein C4527_05645 [Candidatus Omnitrophota bacterium]|jgi:hypothetical protein|nr:MAG: hypothetical protein C4527_05645 [Candidatus Omnitrophota bacterium]
MKMRKKGSILGLLLLAVVGLSGEMVFAQGSNDGANFMLDFLTTESDTQTQSVIEDTPIFYTITDGGETKIRFDVTLVLKNAVNLVGVNCDMVFDPAKLKVVSIHEARGDLNFDGRSNIADVLVLGELFNRPTSENGYSYFDRYLTGGSAGMIDYRDVETLLPYVNESNLFWTSNANLDFSLMRESVEIFESPDISNARGKIDDIVVVLLSRIHPIPAGFGFDGDARIADITFEVIGDISEGTTIRLEDRMAIDEGTVITQTEISQFSVPTAEEVRISRP